MFIGTSVPRGCYFVVFSGPRLVDKDCPQINPCLDVDSTVAGVSAVVSDFCLACYMKVKL